MRAGFPSKASALVCVLFGLAGLRGDFNLSAQADAVQASPFQPGAATHDTHAQFPSSLELANTRVVAPKDGVVLPPTPTRSSFMAMWPNVSGAKGYLLDVSTTSSFSKFVDGYHDLDVGDATGRVVIGLRRGTTYY